MAKWDSWPPKWRPILNKNPNALKYEYHFLSGYKDKIKTAPLVKSEPALEFIVFGVVAQILQRRPTDQPTTGFRIRITDETLKGVLVRIHMSQGSPVKGPPIKVNDIIKIQSSCIQNERIDHVREMVVSVAAHYRYTLFNYNSDVDAPIIPASCSTHIDLLDEDMTRVKELREFLNKAPDLLTDW